MVEAKRSSKNCPAGTPELKCASIDKVWYKKYLVDKDRGGNTNKIPHLGKNKWVRLGDLPLPLPCSSEAVKIGKAALDDVVV
ncbi:hypothetical protein L917_06641 [Phytophthora nicotianae]|uniref:Uncharacterized protein n=2 Tax=Phytophthora nicotianae TaxID=4792 RepID=V9FEB0_PHYNI|nr:hypothetical protein F443_06952 [Phytophthora nicotianae P1569]ETL95585.1 hypothetical protein L917_06641 [Phytophthora nicotianae]